MSIINNDMEEYNEDIYQFAFDINGVLALKGVIDYSIKTWPGSPARHAQEQEFLWYMRDLLNKCVMEHSFYNLEVDK